MYNHPITPSVLEDLTTRQQQQAPELGRVSAPGQLGELLAQAHSAQERPSFWQRLRRK